MKKVSRSIEILALACRGANRFRAGNSPVECHPSASSVVPRPNCVRCIRMPDGFFVAQGYWSQLGDWLKVRIMVRLKCIYAVMTGGNRRVHSVLYTTPRPVSVVRTYLPLTRCQAPFNLEVGDESTTARPSGVMSSSPNALPEPPARRRLVVRTVLRSNVLVSRFLAVSHSAYEKKRKS